MRKAIAVCLSAFVIVCSFCGCTPKWCVKCGGVTVSTDIFKYYICQSYITLVSEGKINKDAPLSKQTIESGSSEDYIYNEALNSALFYCSLINKFKDAGLEISSEVEDSLKVTANSEYTQNSEIFKELGVTENAVYEASLNGKMGYMRQELFKHTYLEGENAVGDDELNEFFNSNYVCYSYLYAFTGGDDGASAKAELKDIVKKINDGENIDKYAQSYANAYAEDENCGKNGITTSTSVINNTEIIKEASELENGEAEYIEMGNYAFVVQRHDIFSTSFISDNRYSVLVEMKLDGFCDDILQEALSDKFSVKESYVRSLISSKL